MVKMSKLEEKAAADVKINILKDKIAKPNMMGVIDKIQHIIASTKTQQENCQISTSEAIKAIKFRQEIRRNYITLPCPILFFLLFVACTLTHYPPNMLYLVKRALKGNLITTGSNVVNKHSTIQFNNIKTREDVYTWLNTSFVPTVFDATPRGKIAGFNRILGAIEVVVQNAKITDCKAPNQPNLLKIYSYCFDGEEFHQKTIYFDSDLPSTKVRKSIFESKRNENWIIHGTKKIEITIPTYNGELQIFGITKLIIEFEIGGFTSLTTYVATALSNPYGQYEVVLTDILFVLCYAVMIYYHLRTMYQYFQAGHNTQFFQDFWSILDLSAIVFVFLTLFWWYIVVIHIYDEEYTSQLASITGDSHTFVETSTYRHKTFEMVVEKMSKIADFMVLVHLLSMISCLLLALRILKHFRFQPRLAVLTNTISKSMHEFGPFIFVTAIVYSGFVIAAYILFGDDIEEFSSLKNSASTCVNMLFGNFEIEALQDESYTFAFVFYWSYMIIMFLILMNMMLAIILDSYSEVKSINLENRSIIHEVKAVFKDSLLGVYITKKSIEKEHKISRRKLKYELTNGLLRDEETISTESLMRVFSVSEETANRTIASLVAYQPPSSVTTKKAKHVKKMQQLEAELVNINSKIDLILQKLQK